MSQTADLLDGLAAALDSAGVGTYDPTRTWTAADTATAIVAGSRVVPQCPDRVVVLADYPVRDDPFPTSSGVLGVQLRFRGAPNDLASLLDARDTAYRYLQGLMGVTWGGTHVAVVVRNSSLPLGVDANQRDEHADNYYLTVDYPVTAARPD